MHAGEASGRAAWPVQGREEGSVEGSRAEAKTARAPGQGSLGSRALPRGSRGNPLPLGALRPADRAKPSCRVSAAGLRTLWGEGQSRLARNDRRPIEPRAPGGLAGRRSNWTLSRHPEHCQGHLLRHLVNVKRARLPLKNVSSPRRGIQVRGHPSLWVLYIQQTVQSLPHCQGHLLPHLVKVKRESLPHFCLGDHGGELTLPTAPIRCSSPMKCLPERHRPRWSFRSSLGTRLKVSKRGWIGPPSGVGAQS
ncbi:uncharacterized protein LOC120319784 isoform X1 [Crotalus tigris]|uniref:uncharacterized protein LOC120319784 isoform X1 n=1 Tax=Crotalus tigris TaxID=88082 RepID=UPI00192F7CBD|nr:uncharacterized protein LOC120319784 isoform X1 [Crotalus tigris]